MSTHITENNPPGRPRTMVVRIPYPIPVADRVKLMEAGRAAVKALEHGKTNLWLQRHARVEQVIAAIAAKYGIEEQENEPATV